MVNPPSRSTGSPDDLMTAVNAARILDLSADMKKRRREGRG